MTTTEQALTETDIDTIASRASAAEACLDGAFEPGEYAEREQAERDLEQLVREDVNVLLCELERRQVSHDTGYVAGLKAATGLLADFERVPVDGFDQHQQTCRRLAEAVRGMLASARERLGVDDEEDR